MPRNAIPSQAPASPNIAGDDDFLRLDMKTPRDKLPPGTLGRAENIRFIPGAGPRAGTRTPGFANTSLPAGLSLLGSGVYSNPNGYEMLLLAAANAVYSARSGTIPRTIPIPATLTGAIEFSQHYSFLLLHFDDPSRTTLVWDGLSFDSGFVPIASENLGEGIQQIPNTPWSIDFLGRNWFVVPGEPNAVGASDVPSNAGPGYDRWDSILHKFTVNLGTADRIIGLYPYQQSSLVVGKTRSIDVLFNIPDDLGDSFLNAITAGLAPASAPPPGALVVSTSIGMVARKCVVMVGSDLLFLSDSGGGGIYRITPSGSGLEVDPMPVSDPIEPLIRRINWAYAGGATAQLDGIYAYFAVPLDGATFNNAVLVLNVATGQWQGTDLWHTADDRPPRSDSEHGGGIGRRVRSNPLQIDNLFRLDFYGVARIFAVSHPSARTRLLYEGADDQLDLADSDAQRELSTYPIQSLLETRGYPGRDIRAVALNLLTRDPSISIFLLVEGPGDERLLAGDPATFDRTKYDNSARVDYVLNNRNKDFEAPQRLDYSVEVGDAVLLQDGIRIARFAPSTLRYSLFARGWFVSFRIENYGGVANLLSLVMESSATTREERRAG